jgi:hypothetical protein
MPFIILYHPPKGDGIDVSRTCVQAYPLPEELLTPEQSAAWERVFTRDHAWTANKEEMLKLREGGVARYARWHNKPHEEARNALELTGARWVRIRSGKEIVGISPRVFSDILQKIPPRASSPEKTRIVKIDYRVGQINFFDRVLQRPDLVFTKLSRYVPSENLA